MSSLIIEVCKVQEVCHHPNADRLDIVKVKGWECIVGRDQYKEGDLVVFCPPDSIIPKDLVEKYELEYLKKDGRVGATRLRKVMSYGLVLNAEPSWKEGKDVASILGITKYDPPEPSYSKGKGGSIVSRKKQNPLFFKYTDIENIRNFMDVFKEGEEVIVTEKIHGANTRVARLPIWISNKQNLLYRIKNWINKMRGIKSEFVYGSRNVQLFGSAKKNNFYGDDVWGKVVKKYNLENIIPENHIVYGEVYGSGIQDLTYGMKDGQIDLIIFDILVNGNWASWDYVVNFCEENNLPHVPVIYRGSFKMDDVLKMCEGKSILYPPQIREGVVVKTTSEESGNSNRKILKVINPDYLTRKGGTEFK